MHHSIFWGVWMSKQQLVNISQIILKSAQSSFLNRICFCSETGNTSMEIVLLLEVKINWDSRLSHYVVSRDLRAFRQLIQQKDAIFEQSRIEVTWADDIY